MRKFVPLFAVTLLFSGVAMAFNADEKTYKGDAVCAKCALKETAKCQNTVKVDEGGKSTTYYITHDAVSKKAHQSLGICTAKKDAPIKVVVTGTMEEKDGKKVITASKIEEDK
jgi:Family of unknown function (DUF6370)